MRGRESVMAEPYSFDETNAWLEMLDLPPIEDGEQSVDWDKRVFGGIEASRRMLPQAVRLEAGGENG